MCPVILNYLPKVNKYCNLVVARGIDILATGVSGIAKLPTQGKTRVVISKIDKC